MPVFKKITLDSSRHKNVSCHRCGRKLQIGDKAWSHMGCTVRYYCNTCYDKIWR